MSLANMTCVLQTQRSECSLACLAMIASAYGMHTDLVELRRRLPLSTKGANLQQTIKHAAAIGFSCRPVSLEMHELQELQLPCILHWDMKHFVVLRRVTRTHLEILDPAVGRRKVSISEAARHFSGVALELTPNAEFRQRENKPRLQVSQLTGRVIGLKRALLQIFALALVLELFAIAAPLFNQMVVDDVLTSGDRELLTVLAIGFGLLLLAQALVALMRSWMVMVMGQSLSLQWAGNVFAHLIKLPVSYFETRHLGDVVSRFGSIDTIQRTLTTSVLEAVLDGLMAAGALAMMLIYSPKLAAVTACAVLAYGLLRWVRYRPFREAAAERLVLAARASTHFMESLRAITPLKLFGREEERRARWQNLVVQVQNRDVRTAAMRIAFSTGNTLIFGAENLIVFCLGAGMVMNASLTSLGAPTEPFTIGMLMAYIGYKGQFTGRVSALIDYLIELRMLGLHTERLADIALATPDFDSPGGNAHEHDLGHLPSTIALRDISFRYGEGEPWVLRHANLEVRAGESVAVTGASGAGKTTLLKLMLGLLEPTEGNVLYGGVPLRQLGRANVRAQIGTVMQEDVLLSGTLSENISFFDIEANQELIELAAKTAQVHPEIVRMPMGYQTLVGDMGSGLSGGQKQRILLARALYKRPKVLALDEATSHLDVANERAAAVELSRLNITRIVIAHRPETIAGALRVVQVKDGMLAEVVRAISCDSGIDAA